MVIMKPRKRSWMLPFYRGFRIAYFHSITYIHRDVNRYIKTGTEETVHCLIGFSKTSIIN